MITVTFASTHLFLTSIITASIDIIWNCSNVIAMIPVAIAMIVPWTLASHLTFTGISYCLVSRTSLVTRIVWYIAFPGISYMVLSGLSYFLVSRSSWYIVLRCILYWLVSPSSWCVVLLGVSCWLVSRTSWYLVRPGISYYLVSRKAWYLVL